MDTQNDIRMACGEMQQEITGFSMVVGARQLRKALLQGRVFRVYLAVDADPAITEPIAALCQTHQVDYRWISSMKELGKACKIDVGAAAAAALL